MDRNVALRSDLQIGDTIQIRSTQGTDDEFFELKIVGLVDGQSYFFQPTIFVPAATWEKIRPQSESELASDTPYPNIIAVKLTDPSLAATFRPLDAVPVKGIASPVRIFEVPWQDGYEAGETQN